MVDEPAAFDDPTQDVHEWELSPRERRIWEAGFITGHAVREVEVEQLNWEADRLYRTAFDHRDCTCWKRHRNR